MKKILLMACVAMIAVACGQKKSQKVLVLYYSQNGTTKVLADEIANRLNADVETIVPVNPYNGSYEETIERGKLEKDSNFLPDIQPLKANVKDYDVIFIGYPIWFGTYPQPIATLLSTTDFSGKKLVPFCTFGSGGLDSSIKDLKSAQPNAEIFPGYGVRAARINAIPAELDRFLIENGFVKGECEKLAEFSDAHAVTVDESDIFDTAVAGYKMIHAKAEEVSSRSVPGGVEYLFVARELPRDDAQDGAPTRTFKVNVLVENGKAPVFTQVVR